MGIPISNYIDTKSKYIKAGSSNVDFSALVFTKEAMLTWSGSGTDPYATIRADYGNNGKVVSLDKETALALFATSGATYAFLTKYFGDASNPSTVNLFKVGESQTAIAAFTSATANFSNFGSLTFIDSFVSGDVDGRVSVGEALANTNYVLIAQTNTTDYSTTCTAFATCKDNVFVVEGETTTIDSVSYQFIAAAVCAWYAGVNYSTVNSSDTINYRQFPLFGATVNTGAGKTAHDTVKCNYIGKVQTHGLQTEFMQKGILLNGIELGVFRDKAWIEALIENRWLEMATGKKIPANYTGSSKVLSMVIGVASEGINAGAILIEKTLTSAQISDIYDYTGNDSAASEVQTNGYFVDAKIVVENNQYICQYTLVYAKGDSINKVSGTHYLV